MYVDRPPSPTILSATPVSACMADIVWTIPLPSPTEAVPSYIQFEVFLVGSSRTSVEIGRVYMAPSTQLQQPTSFRGIIPPGGVNTSYYLRARSVNDSIGESDIYQVPDPFTAYMEGGCRGWKVVITIVIIVWQTFFLSAVIFGMQCHCFIQRVGCRGISHS